MTDATCPKVMRIHKIVERASEEGRFVVIIGMRRHPEVEAIEGWCAEHVVAENAEELKTALSDIPLDKPLTMVVQTTQTHSNFSECTNILKKYVQIRKYLIQYVTLRPHDSRKRPVWHPNAAR